MTMKTNDDHVFYRTPTKYYPTVERGEGVYIYDKDGRQYIDGSGGAAVVNIGHGVKEVEEAMLQQAGRIALPTARSSRAKPQSAWPTGS